MNMFLKIGVDESKIDIDIAHRNQHGRRIQALPNATLHALGAHFFTHFSMVSKHPHVLFEPINYNNFDKQIKPNFFFIAFQKLINVLRHIALYNLFMHSSLTNQRGNILLSK